MTIESTASTLVVREIAARPITRAAFAPFGEVIEEIEDGVRFGVEDAKLDLSRGTPRFYIMRLGPREPLVRRLTRHRQVTQCLAAVGGGAWMIAVAPPGAVEDERDEPALDAIRAFSIPGNVAIKLHRGAWHAGPFFAGSDMSFFNLELADTNEVDHQNSLLDRRFGVALKLLPLSSIA
jgi:ureidoglycolate hydrolase